MSGGTVILLCVLALVLLLILRRGGSSTPPVPPAPGGPQQLGTFQTTRIRNPVVPVQPSSPSPVSAPDWNTPTSSGTRQPLSPEEAQELGKLDSLRATGTLTEDAYLQARARLFGIGGTAGWSVTILSSGSNKIAAIKAMRACRRDLDLKGAKNFVDALPQVLFKGLSQADAERVRHYCEQDGVSVRLQQD